MASDQGPNVTDPGEGENIADGTNTGPYGSGPYDNDENYRADSGTTHAREGTSRTGEFMGEMPTPPRVTIPTVSGRPANAAEMGGGNASGLGNAPCDADDLASEPGGRSAAARSRPAS